MCNMNAKNTVENIGIPAKTGRIVHKVMVLALTAILILLSSCAARESVDFPVAADYEATPGIERKNLKLGIASGPYGDMFMDTIEPFLAQRGYTVELVCFDDFIQPNIALENGEIDMNLFQHNRYLNKFKFDYDLALSAITEMPTASMGIFSSKFDSLTALHGHITASIPDDSTNLARALRVMEAAGLLIINPLIDKSKATVNDIIDNPHNIQFTLIKAHNLAASLDDYDLSLINGNYALSDGLNLSDALYNEVLVDGYINVIAVRTKDLSAAFVSDIIDIVYSDAYRQGIVQHDIYKGFRLPLNFYDTRDWGSDE